MSTYPNINITDYQGFKIQRVRYGVSFIIYSFSCSAILGIGGFITTGGEESLLAWLFVALALLLLFSSGFAFMKTLRRDNEINHLIGNGNKVVGRLTNILTLGIRGDQYYKLVVSVGSHDDVVTNYESDKLNGIGSLALADYHNSLVNLDVYVNSANPKKYYIDLSAIKSLSKDEISDVYRTLKDNQSN